MKRYLLLLLFTASVVKGQSIDSTHYNPLQPANPFKLGFGLELGIMSAYTQLSNFHSFLEVNQIHRPQNFNAFLTIANALRIGRVKFMMHTGVNLYDINNQPSANGWVVRSQRASIGGFNLGYDVLNSRNRRLYVGGGIGGIILDYNLYRRSTQRIPFNSVLITNPPSSVPSLRLQNAGYVEGYIEYGMREKRKRSVDYTLRVGYRRGMYQHHWSSDVYRFSDPLTDRVGQFYFQSTIALFSNANRVSELFNVRR